MTELPNPLTPEDCDLRDFQYMPLDVQRLCDSDLAALESPEACWAALLLWCKAWHQVPSASLPDDDRVLAKFTGYQRAPDSWQAIREGALRGWVKCSDGRLYHPVVAEKANEAWYAKHRQAHEKLCERIRKRNKSRVESGFVPLEVPELEQWIDMGRPLEKSLFPSEFSSTSGGNSGDFRRKQDVIPAEGNIVLSGKAGSASGKSGDQSSELDESADSAGFGASSDGNEEQFRRNTPEIPPENALKGKGTEGKGEGEVKTIGSNDGSGTPRATDENALTAADVSKSIIAWERDRHKAARGVTPSNQQVIELAELNITAHELRKAYECAVSDRDATGDVTPVNAGFVRTFIEKNRRPQRAKKPAPPPVWKLDDVSLERLGIEIGLGRARSGESRDSYVARIEARQIELTERAA